MPGLWIYEINQGYEEPFLRIPPHLVNYCKGAYLKPSSVPLYSGPESLPEVKIECTGVIGGNQDVVVKLIGSSFNKSIDAEYNYDEVKVIIPVPVFWGVDEVAQISMTVEGMPEKKIDATISFKPELVDGPLQIEHRSNNEIEVTWPSVTLNETTSFFVNQFTYNGNIDVFCSHKPLLVINKLWKRATIPLNTPYKQTCRALSSSTIRVMRKAYRKIKLKSEQVQ